MSEGELLIGQHETVVRVLIWIIPNAVGLCRSVHIKRGERYF
jgi:hypothetical protein